MIDRAGLVGNDGPTHHGCFDLAYLGTLPDIVIMAPADEIELMRMIKTSYMIDVRARSASLSFFLSVFARARGCVCDGREARDTSARTLFAPRVPVSLVSRAALFCSSVQRSLVRRLTVRVCA
eukprot:3935091-Rhodomonas_salina.2